MASSGTCIPNLELVNYISFPKHRDQVFVAVRSRTGAFRAIPWFYHVGGDAGLRHLRLTLCMNHNLWPLYVIHSRQILACNFYCNMIERLAQTPNDNLTLVWCPGHSEQQMRELMSWHKRWIPCLEQLTHALMSLMRTKAWKKQGLCAQTDCFPLITPTNTLLPRHANCADASYNIAEVYAEYFYTKFSPAVNTSWPCGEPLCECYEGVLGTRKGVKTLVKILARSNACNESRLCVAWVLHGCFEVPTRTGWLMWHQLYGSDAV